MGLGRAPGTDRQTWSALRRNAASSDHFPQDAIELQKLLGPIERGQSVIAVPGAGTNVPFRILGSSLFGAHVAAASGLPFAFASHFAPSALLPALEAYCEGFKPSLQLHEPYAMAGVNVVVADSDQEARRLFTSIQQRFVGMLRGDRGYLKPPIDDIESYWTPQEKIHATEMLKYAFVGSPATVSKELHQFIAETRVNELMVTSAIYDHTARLKSYELLAGISDHV